MGSFSKLFKKHTLEASKDRSFIIFEVTITLLFLILIPASRSLIEQLNPDLISRHVPANMDPAVSVLNGSLAGTIPVYFPTSIAADVGSLQPGSCSGFLCDTKLVWSSGSLAVPNFTPSYSVKRSLEQFIVDEWFDLDPTFPTYGSILEISEFSLTGSTEFIIHENQTNPIGPLRMTDAASTIMKGWVKQKVAKDIEFSTQVFPSDATTVGINIEVQMLGPYMLYLLLFPMPFIVTMIVNEKVKGMKDLLLSSGLRNSTYWLACLSFSMCFCLASNALLYIIGFSLRLDFFVHTSFWLILLMFIIWDMFLVMTSVFIASFFSSARFVALISFIVVFMVSEPSSGTAMLALGPEEVSDILLIPTIAITKICTHMNALAVDGDVELSRLTEGGTLTEYYKHLLLGILLCGIIYAFIILLRILNSKRKNRTVYDGDAIVNNATVSIAADLLEVEEQNAMSNEGVITIKHAVVQYPEMDRPAVNNLSFVCHKGEITVLAGINGAGKSSLCKAISGINKLSNGDIIVDGCSVNNDIQGVRQKLGVCPQDSIFWPSLSARLHLEVFGTIRGSKGEVLEKEIDDLLEQMNLSEHANRPVKGFSGGMKRRLVAAMAFVGDPDILVLDEVSTSLSPDLAIELQSYVRKIAKDKTVILTTHSISEVEALADKIYLISNGSPIAVGTTQELKKRFGDGYNVVLVGETGEDVTPKADIFKNEFQTAELVDIKDKTASFRVSDVAVSELFRFLSDMTINHFSVSYTSLQDVLSNLVAQQSSSATDSAKE
ncbi:hypothetical protein PCE1_001821 [Barthelona sp. PCE]